MKRGTTETTTGQRADHRLDAYNIPRGLGGMREALTITTGTEKTQPERSYRSLIAARPEKSQPARRNHNLTIESLAPG